MPEQYENQLRDFSFYDSMSTDALERLLRADAQKLDDDIDIDAILYITDLLHERSVKNNEYTVDVDAMLRSMPFYTGPKDVVAPEDEAAVKPKAMTELKKRKTRSILRRCALVAAIVCILFLMSGVASAFGFNFWSKLAVWTDDVFGIVDNENVDAEMPAAPVVPEDLAYSSLQEALDEIGIDIVREPDFSNLDFVLTDINVMNNETSTVILADYCSSEKAQYLSVSVRKVRDATTVFYEKTEDSVEPFCVGNTQCYAFYNTNDCTVIWMVGEYKCSVTGTMPMDEIKMLAQSMIEH